ncbi:hypothetical protein ATI61_103270 [Archangium gephyra]|uniref:Uncharacterized protein n=1 Tax=Archangium gephyra TaxID=48 RepID=A0AAC8Q5Y0_9BACT|nr:hypothetical protein [Archangium gephyra]AKJ01559.1 Hypothetical protein AA314_03185 [Archangium gephyra]REG34377.1 hypothetical protein ATI61_103270 [Archangium gephyra]
MARWNESPEWARYKTYYQQIRDVKSVSQLETLTARVADFGPGLQKVFPGNEALARELVQILLDQLGNKRRMLRQPRGRGPRPDWGEELERYAAALGHELHALRGLRQLGGGEPWLDEVLVPAMRYSRSVVESRLLLVERESLGASREALLTQARALLRDVDAELGPPPPKP